MEPGMSFSGQQGQRLELLQDIMAGSASLSSRMPCLDNGVQPNLLYGRADRDGVRDTQEHPASLAVGIAFSALTLRRDPQR